MLFFISCSKVEFEETLPETNINTSLFGACFERTLSDPSDPWIEEISFPIVGNSENFEAFHMSNRLLSKNGIRSISVELRQFAYFENFDSSMFSRGTRLTFKFNIGTTSDIVSGTPFSKEELEDFLIVGKMFNSTINKLGTIEMEYFAHDEEDVGTLTKNFLMGDDSAELNKNNVTIKNVEEFVDKDYDGNILSNGFKVDLEFKFTGTIRLPDLPHPYMKCELNKGKASLYIPYE